MRDLRSRVIRLAYANEALRPHLLPVLKKMGSEPHMIDDMVAVGVPEQTADDLYGMFGKAVWNEVAEALRRPMDPEVIDHDFDTIEKDVPLGRDYVLVEFRYPSALTGEDTIEVDIGRAVADLEAALRRHGASMNINPAKYERDILSWVDGEFTHESVKIRPEAIARVEEWAEDEGDVSVNTPGFEEDIRTSVVVSDDAEVQELQPLDLRGTKMRIKLTLNLTSYGNIERW